MSKRLFVDMDGTLCEFKVVDTLETLYESGYFLNLKPHMNVVNAVKDIVAKDPDIEVFILSAYLSDSKYALDEKHRWLDTYLPEIDAEHRYFMHCGTDKKDFIAKRGGGVTIDDYLLDDYSLNLHSWQPPARGIKFMNGINGTHGTWNMDSLGISRSAEDLALCIRNIIHKGACYNDVGPNHEGPVETSFHRPRHGR